MAGEDEDNNDQIIMMMMIMKVGIPPHQSLLVRVLDLHLRGNSGTGQ